MFGLLKLWEAVAQLADALRKLAGTVEKVSNELEARCSLPPPQEATALPPPAPTNGGGNGAEPAEARKPRKAAR
jgi:hypothetical protein